MQCCEHTNLNMWAVQIYVMGGGLRPIKAPHPLICGMVLSGADGKMEWEGGREGGVFKMGWAQGILLLGQATVKS